MKYYLTIIFISFLLISCNKKNSLSNTVWEFKFDEEYSDSLVFLNNKDYRFYSAELEIFTYGNYQMKNDILFLIEKDTIENNIQIRRYTFKIIEGKLRPTKLEEKKNDKWINTNFKFDSTYVFLKLQSK